MHRHPTPVQPAENVGRNAPTGPGPAFQQAYLERAAAYRPDQPDPPITEHVHEPFDGEDRSNP